MTGDPPPGARIFLVDDHPAVLDGLALLLAQDSHTVCGEAKSRAEALLKIDACGADLALVDLALCGESGLELIPELSSRGIPVLVYSMHEDQATQQRALDRGARGYVTKRETSAVLLEAVRCVLAGERFLAGQAPVQPEAPGRAAAALPAPLSEREQQILDSLSRGESTTEIAVELGVSVRTVETYCSRILLKLSLVGMRELRKYAIQMRKAN